MRPAAYAALLDVDREGKKSSVLWGSWGDRRQRHVSCRGRRPPRQRKGQILVSKRMVRVLAPLSMVAVVLEGTRLRQFSSEHDVCDLSGLLSCFARRTNRWVRRTGFPGEKEPDHFTAVDQAADLPQNRSQPLRGPPDTGQGCSWICMVTGMAHAVLRTAPLLGELGPGTFSLTTGDRRHLRRTHASCPPRRRGPPVTSFTQ